MNAPLSAAAVNAAPATLMSGADYRESLRRLGAVFAGAVLSPLGLGIALAEPHYKFRRRPRINATQDDGVRKLAGGGDLLVVAHVARLGFAGSKTFIALLE